MSTKNRVQIILLFGALWGICEASIGHLLHFLPHGLSGMVMVPIGFYFMYTAYKKSEKRSTIIMVGLLAASIKLIDLLLPSLSPMAVINPAMSIMIESLLVFSFAKVLEEKRTFMMSIIMGILWISIFTLVQALILKPASGLYLQPVYIIASVILINAFVSGSIITLLLKRANFSGWEIDMRRPSFVLPAFTLILAFTLEYFNSMIL
jgi:hypothetical protein